ncbi:Hypothetical protein FKW44_005835 [Caligus rogercresseyi]|uniref:Uncharacterized protein n=1 Tax=Caligus rogercresseyi TaxID=217165 RepID=A0A7T8KCG7_CALRO|nr:Hypothetical protein FKW44_005835 [Caligus rogercresseyi]
MRSSNVDVKKKNVDVKKKKNVDVKNWRQLKKSEDAKSFTKPHWLKSCQLMPSRDCQSLFTPTRLEIQLQ